MPLSINARRQSCGGIYTLESASRRSLRTFPRERSPKRSQRCTRTVEAAFGAETETDKDTENSQERFLDVEELLSGAPEDFVFEDGEGMDEDIWEHEKRFMREAPSGNNAPAAKVKGALDPTQADILSAYSPEQGFKEVSAEELLAKIGNEPSINIIDVRTPEEFAGGRIRGSRNIPLDKLSAAVRNGDVSADGAVIVICAKGGRSAQACVRLSKVFKFEDVTNVKGGMSACAASGLPIES